LLLDEDGGWLLVGGKDHVYLLCPDRLDLPTHTVRPSEPPEPPEPSEPSEPSET